MDGIMHAPSMVPLHATIHPLRRREAQGSTSWSTCSELQHLGSGLHSTLYAYMYGIRTCTEYGLFLPYMREIRSAVQGLAWHVVVARAPEGSYGGPRETRRQQNHITTSSYAYARHFSCFQNSWLRGSDALQGAPWCPAAHGRGPPLLQGLDWHDRIFSVFDRILRSDPRISRISKIRLFWTVLCSPAWAWFLANG